MHPFYFNYFAVYLRQCFYSWRGSGRYYYFRVRYQAGKWSIMQRIVYISSRVLQKNSWKSCIQIFWYKVLLTCEKSDIGAYIAITKDEKHFCAVHRICSHERPFDNLWRRLAAKPITSACERKPCRAILPFIGTGVTYRRAFTVRQRRCLYVINYCLPRSFAIYLVTYGPSNRFNLRSRSLSPFPLARV